MRDAIRSFAHFVRYPAHVHTPLSSLLQTFWRMRACRRSKTSQPHVIGPLFLSAVTIRSHAANERLRSADHLGSGFRR